MNRTLSYEELIVLGIGGTLAAGFLKRQLTRLLPKNRRARRASDDPMDRVIAEMGGIRFTCRDLMMNCLVLGGLGSGKSTTMYHLALACLRAGWGAHVLCAKEEEVGYWIKLAALADRSSAVRLIGPDHPEHSLSVLEHEFWATGQIEGVSRVLGTIIDAFERRSASSGGGGDEFFRRAAEQLIRYAVTLVILGEEGRVSIARIAELIESAPTKEFLADADANLTDEQLVAARVWRARSAYWGILIKCRNKYDSFTPAMKRDFATAANYFNYEFASLAPETRTSVQATFSSCSSVFSLEPMRSQFSGKTGLIPEGTWLEGQIQIQTAATHTHGITGLMGQVVWKTAFIEAAKRRNTKECNRPVLLWGDEYQQFVLRQIDQEFACVSRSKLISMVGLTQNLSNLHAVITNKAEVESLVSNMKNRFVLSVDDPATQQTCSTWFGQSLQVLPSGGGQDNYHPIDLWGEVNPQGSWSTQMRPNVEPDEISSLAKAGGKRRAAECIVYRGGEIFPGGKNFRRVWLPQLLLD